MQNGRPALLGGAPVFDTPVPLIRPSLQIDERLFAELREILLSGMLTNGARVSAFEEAVAGFLGVPEVVAVGNCTLGLLLVLRSLGTPGEVVLPSFTFMATGHAVLWNTLTPVFADIDRRSANVDPAAVARAVTPRTVAVVATHVFGAPADADALEAVTDRADVPLVFDAAHGFGAAYPGGRKVGSRGLAEVFSLSPTKTLVAGEGGLVATADRALAAELRIAREYGNPGDYNSLFAGLNGRLTEWNAVLGRRNLERLPEWLDRRRSLARRYLSRSTGLPGIRFQQVAPGAVSTYKDLACSVDPESFGMARNDLVRALRAEHIPTRCYFDPPLHRQTTYRGHAGTALPETESLAATTVTLPLYSHMPAEHVDRVCSAIECIQDNALAVAGLLAAQADRGVAYQ